MKKGGEKEEWQAEMGCVCILVDNLTLSEIINGGQVFKHRTSELACERVVNCIARCVTIGRTVPSICGGPIERRCGETVARVDGQCNVAMDRKCNHLEKQHARIEKATTAGYNIFVQLMGVQKQGS